MTNDRQKRAARAEQMRKERERADKRQRNVITIAIVAVVVVLVGVAAYGIKQTSDDNKDESNVVQPANTTDDYGVAYTPEVAGATVPDGAEPVEVELYEDFQCPACEAFEAVSGGFLKEQVEAGAISLVYKPYSFLDRASRNEYSSRATNVAMCVLGEAGVEKYVEFHDYLYANQPAEGTAGPEDDELIDAAADLGVTGIDACVDQGRHLKWIEEAKEAATEDRDVSGTPTVYIAGEESEARTPDELRAAIEAARG